MIACEGSHRCAIAAQFAEQFLCILDHDKFVIAPAGGSEASFRQIPGMMRCALFLG